MKQTRQIRNVPLAETDARELTSEHVQTRRRDSSILHDGGGSDGGGSGAGPETERRLCNGGSSVGPSGAPGPDSRRRRRNLGPPGRLVQGLISALIAAILSLSCAGSPLPHAELFRPAPDDFYQGPCKTHWDLDQLPLLLIVEATDKEFLGLVHKAATFWNDSIEIEIFRVIEVEAIPPLPPFGRIIPVWQATDLEARYAGKTGFSLDNECGLLRAAVQIRAGLDADIRLSVVTHELGHVLGLQHSWRKESLMYPSARRGAPLAIEPETLDELRETYRP